MKRILIVSIVALLLTGGCQKEELTHVTDFEMKVHRAVNTYRATKSLPEISLQLIMVNDAQQYSRKIATGQVPYGVDDVMTSLETLKNNLGGDAYGAVVQFSETDNADSIVTRMVRDTLKRAILELDFNQTGVGSAQDAEGHWYITQIFIHIP